MKAVVFYEVGDDVREKAPLHWDAHEAWLKEFHERGDLLMVGTFADVMLDGSMAIFRTKEAAEEFVKDDPFVVNGVAKGYSIKEWNETLVP